MRLRRISSAMAGVLTLASVIVLSAPPSAHAANAAITSATGPLTKIEISPDLTCNVQHRVDPAPEFFGGNACGTLVALGPTTATSTLYGPADIPAGENASPRTPFTPVSQSGVSGTGTIGDPYLITTVVALGDTGVQLTETDSYVAGNDWYRTDVAINNSTSNEVRAIVYRVGDCFLQGSDQGYGKFDPNDGSIACVASTSPATRTEKWTPLTSGSRYYEAGFQSVWTKVGTRTEFPSTCECSTFQDNGAGLSWTVTVLAGQTNTVSHRTTLSPGPPAVVKSADKDGVPPSPAPSSAAAPSSPSAPSLPIPGAPGATPAPTTDPNAKVTDGYTISVINPTATPIKLATITDNLPAGFSYVPNSTTGVTTTEPVISNNGSTLTWKEPKGKVYTVPAFDSISLHFNVYVPQAPTCGTFYNDASASGDTPVAPAVHTAPVTVFCQADLVAEPAVIDVNNPPGVNLFTLKAHLTDHTTHAGLAGRFLTFTAMGKDLCGPVKTDNTGTATCSDISNVANDVQVLINPLGYDVEFKGDGAYSPLKAHGPAVQVGPVPIV
ncbi:MAG: DUF11 domain-containing protein [Actinobacteria bacterium]|nr:DUF11 domain-containing protein [Actinomycetota bacterium]